MSKSITPELKRFSFPDLLLRYMDKKLSLVLNGNRQVVGVLRGYDPFLNLVLEEAIEVTPEATKPIGSVIVRGNSISVIEALERIPAN